jgi:hypothetical protein
MRKAIILLGVGVWLLSTCQGGFQLGDTTNKYQQLGIDSCIALPVAYERGDPGASLKPEKTLPLAPWGSITELLRPSPGVFGGNAIVLLRPRNSYDEIWLQSCGWKENESLMCNYLVFRTDTNTIRSATQPVEHMGGGFPEYLFLSKSGDVWGITVYDGGNAVPNLSRYNEQQQAFDPVRDVDNILNTDKHPRFNDYAVDDNGILWLVHGHSLYKFNPGTLKAEEFYVGITNPEEYLTDLTLTRDHLIYLSIPYKKELLRFSTKMHSLMEPLTIDLAVDVIPPFYGPWPDGDIYQIYDSFLDSKDRLWIHNYGWMEPDGNWRALIGRFPGFFGKREVEGSSDYYDWLRPDIILESSDGRLWFRSPNGITWFNADKGEWCWFTTEQSNIVEDQQHNLWMVADNKLYKLDLEP